MAAAEEGEGEEEDAAGLLEGLWREPATVKPGGDEEEGDEDDDADGDWWDPPDGDSDAEGSESDSESDAERAEDAEASAAELRGISAALAGLRRCADTADPASEAGSRAAA